MKRVLALLVLAAVAAAAYGLGLGDYLTFETLRAHHERLTRLVDGHPLAAPLGYMAFYALAVAVSLPGAALMTITGGFLFGAVLGSTLTVLAATLGATLIVLAARTAFGGLLRAKAESSLGRMEEGFRRDAFSYLLVLRLVPLFPFFLVNLVPAFLGVRLSTFVAATLIGIVPATVVFTLAGCGLGSILEAGGEFSLSSVLTPEMIAALSGLALLALAPVVYKRFVRPA